MSLIDGFVSEIAATVAVKMAVLTIKEIWSTLPQVLTKELKKLETTMSTIKAVLLDAEERQAKNQELQLWLWRLKDVYYDIEDVLDEFAISLAQHQETDGNRSTRRKVRKFFSRSNPLAIRNRVASKIKDLRRRLDEIAADKSKFHLTERVETESRRIVQKERRELTHSYILPSEVIGRENDVERIIHKLLYEGEDDDLSVIPIVGIGGLGKTTVAKMVYNDERIDSYFDLKMWVCVPQNFSVAELTRDICNLATGSNCSGLNIEQLQSCLRGALKGKRYLLVLDDVWNDKRAKWIELRDLLIGNALGAKIVVTTRSWLVATIMGTVPAHNLAVLGHEDSLSLFLKRAFVSGQEKQHPNLVKIGRDIVQKCDGVPLAVSTLGNLLYSITDEREWLSIRDNEICKFQQRDNDIISVLKLSYDLMEPHLKQCFAFCSLFPKNYEFYSFELIQFWMAHGLLESGPENEELEDRGLRCFKELCSVSLFQVVQDFEFFFTCKMHDLVHDLALSVAQKECCFLNSLPESFPETVRHFSIVNTSLLGQEVPKSLLQSDKLRTMFFPVKGVGPSDEFVRMSISRFRYLRMLNISDSCLEALPCSIGMLKHLRYLDLFRNVRLKKLPESICSLQNLQTLRLEDCSQLEEIPQGLGNLTNLRFLEITTKQKLLLDNGTECLSSLRFLSFSKCYNLKQLFQGMQHLTSLRTLVIASCGSLSCLPHSLRDLTALETLVIGDCDYLDLLKLDEHDSNKDSKLRLRTLLLGELPELLALPEWLHGSAATLRYLYVDDCPKFMALPEWLQDFSSLEKLEILRCPKLSYLPEGLVHLTALRELKIGLCPQLIRRCQMEDWPKIAHINEIYLDGVKV